MCQIKSNPDDRRAIQAYLWSDIQNSAVDQRKLEAQINHVETGPAGSYRERTGNAHRLQIFAGQAYIETTVEGIAARAVAVPLSVLKEEVVNWDFR